MTPGLRDHVLGGLRAAASAHGAERLATRGQKGAMAGYTLALDSEYEADVVIVATGTGVVRFRSSAGISLLFAHNHNEAGRIIIKGLLEENPAAAIASILDHFPSGLTLSPIQADPSWIDASPQQQRRAEIISAIVTACAAHAAALVPDTKFLQVDLTWPEDGVPSISTCAATDGRGLVATDLTIAMATEVGEIRVLRECSAWGAVESYFGEPIPTFSPSTGLVIDNETRISIDFTSPIDRLRTIARGVEAASVLGVPLDSFIAFE